MTPSNTIQKLTIAEICVELKISRSTFYHWRQIRKAPKCIKLPNGDVRVRRDEFDAWLETCEEAA
jgi:excisionase family DNA binding protein